MMIPFNQSLIDAALQEAADKPTRIWINYKNDNDNVFRLNQLLGFFKQFSCSLIYSAQKSWICSRRIKCSGYAAVAVVDI